MKSPEKTCLILAREVNQLVRHSYRETTYLEGANIYICQHIYIYIPKPEFVSLCEIEDNIHYIIASIIL